MKDYRVGDIDRQYHRLHLEEDRLYAYGFMPQSTWRLLHPKVDRRLNATEKRVLDIVVAHQRIHPRDLEIYLGRKVERNAWGGQSKATTRTLESLHHGGFLRIAGRENGVRVYEPAVQTYHEPGPADRVRQVVLLVASILGPLSVSSLRATLGYVAYAAPALRGARSVVTRLIESGDLANTVVDGVRYVWPAGRVNRNPANETVRFLAPFDPLVWDRRRFEHFWDWPYRFEAYVPAAKRQLGYYAMPMLWRDDVIGWVNVAKQGGTWKVEPGFRKCKPTDRAFGVEYEAEVGRLQIFLQERSRSKKE